MRLLFVLWGLLLLSSDAARADDELGKRRFSEGVGAAEERRWADAARLFEESLAHGDRPATRFNLVLASHELSRPLEVTRHVLAFLAYPDQDAHTEARAKASQLLTLAVQRLASISTQSVPTAATLTIDGAPPSVRDGEQIYLLPGLHRLEAILTSGLVESSELQLTAGQKLPWPRPPEPSPLSSAAPPAVATLPMPTSNRSLSRLRTRLAWSSGVLGAALMISSFGCYLGAEHRADELSALDSMSTGYVSGFDDYLRLTNAILATALPGGVLMVGAVALGERSRHGTLGGSLASLTAGGAALALGTTLMVREPEPVVPGVGANRPSLQAGGLLVSAALPLLTYALMAPFTRGREHKSVVTSVAPLRVSW